MSEQVGFLTAAVFDDEGRLLGVEMTCQVCSEIGYKGPYAVVAHAQTHLPTVTGPWNLPPDYMDRLVDASNGVDEWGDPGDPL